MEQPFALFDKMDTQVDTDSTESIQNGIGRWEMLNKGEIRFGTCFEIDQPNQKQNSQETYQKNGDNNCACTLHGGYKKSLSTIIATIITGR